jgi:TPR repeat protein
MRTGNKAGTPQHIGVYLAPLLNFVPPNVGEAEQAIWRQYPAGASTGDDALAASVSDAMYQLALIHLHGIDRAPVDRNTGMSWLLKSAAAGNANA